MSRSTNLAAALALAATGLALAPARASEVLYPGDIALRSDLRAWAQVPAGIAYGGTYSVDLVRYDPYEGKPADGYLLKAGNAGCRSETTLCADARATRSVADPASLPASFEIRVRPGSGKVAIDAAGVQQEAWKAGTEDALAALPTPPFGKAAEGMRAWTMGYSMGLRDGAVGQADCSEAVAFCIVRIAYRDDLAVTFVVGGGPDVVTAQARAVDGFMRDVIRPVRPPKPKPGPKPIEYELSASWKIVPKF